MTERPMTVGDVLREHMDEMMETPWPDDAKWYEVSFSARVDSDGKPWVDDKGIRPSWNVNRHCCHD